MDLVAKFPAEMESCREDLQPLGLIVELGVPADAFILIRKMVLIISLSYCCKCNGGMATRCGVRPPFFC